MTSSTAFGFTAALSFAEDVVDAVPAEYQLGSRHLYIQAFKNAKEMYSVDGLVINKGKLRFDRACFEDATSKADECRLSL